jgi:RHS repeat-associated protein
LPFASLAPAAFDQATNRISQAGYGYDAAGNLTSYAGRSLTYDAENRQKTLTESGVTFEYFYDGEGRRVKKVAGTTTVYVYDAFGQLAAEYSSGGSTEAERRYVTVDHLGSTRVVTDAGQGAKYYDYYPFGEEIGIGLGGRTEALGYTASGDWVNPKFTGQYRDYESGLRLDYFGARYFGGALGRFTSADQPFYDQYQSNPQSWNLYSYTRNNPLLYVDPEGRGVRVCTLDEDGKETCVNMSDPEYARVREGNPGVVLPSGALPMGDILCGGQKCGTVQYFEESMQLGGGGLLELALLVQGARGLVSAGRAAVEGIGNLSTGSSFQRLGLEGAAEAANAAARAGEISRVVAQAAGTVGNQGVKVSSRAIAEQAADAFVGPGARPILDRSTGQVVGKISRNGDKIARWTSANKPQPYINLENKTTGGNLHVRW